MCGLAGIIMRNETRDDIQSGMIQSAFTKTLIEAQIRGRHASGYALVNNDRSYHLFKRPVEAEQLVDIEGYAEGFVGLGSDKCGLIMGHTRFATQGSKLWNKNNHPIRAGSVIGTHNGSIYNDKELFKKYGLERYADVDSEVLFRLFYSAENPDEFFNDILPVVNGRMTIVFCDIEFPEYVYIVKGNNPFEMAYVKELGVLIYGSTKKILKGGLEEIDKAGLAIDYYKIKKNTMIRVDTRTLAMEKKKIRFKCKPIVKEYVPFNANRTPWAWEKETKDEGQYANTVTGFVPRFSYKEKWEKKSQYHLWDKPRDKAPEPIKVNTDSNKNINRRVTPLNSVITATGKPTRAVKEKADAGISCKCGWKYIGLITNRALKTVLRNHRKNCGLKS